MNLDLTKRTTLSKTSIPDDIKGILSKKKCRYCGEEIGLDKSFYLINGRIYHEECELDILLGLRERKEDDES